MPCRCSRLCARQSRSFAGPFSLPMNRSTGDGRWWLTMSLVQAAKAATQIFKAISSNNKGKAAQWYIANTQSYTITCPQHTPYLTI